MFHCGAQRSRKLCDLALENRRLAPYIMIAGPVSDEPAAGLFTQRKFFDAIIMTERKSSDPISDGHDLAVEEARPKLKEPSMYRVVLINDDYTPMEFVVEVLESIFGMERNTATRVMLEVHTKGKGICGVFTYEIAETKVAQVMGIAQQQQHPLLCTMEES